MKDFGLTRSTPTIRTLAVSFSEVQLIHDNHFRTLETAALVSGGFEAEVSLG
jgi:hypothetical protein